MNDKPISVNIIELEQLLYLRMEELFNKKLEMDQLIKELRKTTYISIMKLHELLLAQIDKDSFDRTEKKRDAIVISKYNLQTVQRIISYNSQSDENVDCSCILSLIETLQNYLNEYMKDQPAGHKWIIICCLFLTYVVKEPMHPQEIVHWKYDEACRKYYCPAYSAEDGSICLYCIAVEEINR